MLPANYALPSILMEMLSITRLSNGDLVLMDPVNGIAI
jgi:hypothetical protein